MIGSFHESMISSRRYSSSTVDGNPLPSIDEDATYDDLVKEIVILRKEREQDKQTIKLLQEQMVCSLNFSLPDGNAFLSFSINTPVKAAVDALFYLSPNNYCRYFYFLEFLVKTVLFLKIKMFRWLPSSEAKVPRDLEQ